MRWLVFAFGTLTWVGCSSADCPEGFYKNDDGLCLEVRTDDLEETGIGTDTDTGDTTDTGTDTITDTDTDTDTDTATDTDTDTGTDTGTEPEPESRIVAYFVEWGI